MKLSEWMEKEEKSYRELAKLTGIDHSAIFRYAKGERTPSIKSALKIEKATKGKVKVKDLV